jgi:hypothetical protein
MLTPFFTVLISFVSENAQFFLLFLFPSISGNAQAARSARTSAGRRGGISA